MRLVNGRWEIVRRLGSGGMGEVHLARDHHQAGREVALKILRAGLDEPGVVESFRDEFRSLARLRHPNLAEVFDFGRTEGDGRPFLTLEYVVGEDLARFDRQQARTRFEDLAGQCLRALAYIHQRGWLHNDIKPQNILIARPFQVKILDFGLAHRLAARDVAGTSGTLHYLAPERLAGGGPDVRSDLYSLGAVLYQVLTGRPPYDAPSAGRIVTAVLQGGAAPARTLDPAITERWERFVMALLARHPDDRPAGAAEALALLNEGGPRPLPLDTPETFASWVASGGLVGRHTEMDLLRGLAIAHASAEPDADPAPARMAMVSGPSGSGKSRLVRELLQSLQLGGARVHLLQCRETGGALQPFADLLRAGRGAGVFSDEQAAALDRVFGGRAADVAADSPATREGSRRRPRFVEQGPSSSGPRRAPRLDKAEMLAALAACLDRLATDGPGVLVLEDLHWIDAAGLDLIEHLLLRARRSRWLLIGTLRDDAPPGGPLASRLRAVTNRRQITRLPLKPLDVEQTTTLLASMLPFAEPPRRLARLLVERTGGAPLHTEEVLKALFAAGSLRRVGAAWELPPSTGDDLPLPASLTALVGRQIAALPETEMFLARMLAVFARPVPVALLARALAELEGTSGGPRSRRGTNAGRGATGDARALEATLRSSRALEALHLATIDWEQADGPWISLPQATVRAAIYGDLETAQRRALHRAAAAALEAHHRGAPDEVAEELAHHCSEAHLTEPAIGYLLHAARRAAALHNPLGQIGFLRRALALMGEGSSERRLDVLDALCIATLNDLGDHAAGLETASRLYAEAKRAQDRRRQVRALRHQCWALGFLGREDESLSAGRRALGAARRLRSTHEIAACLTYLGMVLTRGGHHALARDSFEEAVPLARRVGDPVALTWVLNNAGLCRIALGEPEAAARLLQEVLDVARRHGLSGAYHRYLANVGMVRTDLGDLPGAVSSLEEARSWSRQHTTLELLALQCESLSIVFMLQGRFDLAAAANAESQGARTLLGAQGPDPMTLDLMGQCERGLARYDSARRLHQQGLDESRRRRDRIQEGYLLAALAADDLATGDAAGARGQAVAALAIGRSLPHPRVAFLAERVLAGLAAVSGQLTEVEDLHGRLRSYDQRALRVQDRMERQMALAELSLAAGRPAAAETEARAEIQAADTGGFRELSWRLRLILGRALAGRGLPRQAAAVYHEAVDLLAGIAASIEDTAMREDYRKHPAHSVPDRQDGATREAVKHSRPTPDAASQPGDGLSASRMLATLFEVTQVINSIHDPEELLNKVMDLAIELVSAERGLIFLAREQGDDMDLVVARNVERQTIRDATSYSRGILKEAGRGRSVLSHDAEHDARFRDYRSVLRYRIRSLMCVPLNLRGQTIGTVYVDTRAEGVVFTPEHLKFLESFASQAAIAVENARLIERVRKENESLRQAVNERFGFESIVGRSPRMREVFSLLARVAPSNLPVMVRGESGTGKELVARALHLNSPRRDKAFFSENCAALPDTLLESELFGHVRGAFTGADSARKGLFEMADGGTLFLDEIGDMSMTLQSKLLRALQNGEIRPLGSESTRKVNVRVISATNRDLESMVRTRQFREDLYYRLKGVSVMLPSLRDRRDDIPLLVDHFLRRLASENAQPRLRIEPALLRELARRNWPGNVRELENTVYRLALFAEEGTITLESARDDLQFAEPSPALASPTSVAAITRTALRKALAASGGNRNEAARLLGVSRATFFRRMRDLGVDAGRPRVRTIRDTSKT